MSILRSNSVERVWTNIFTKIVRDFGPIRPDKVPEVVCCESGAVYVPVTPRTTLKSQFFIYKTRVDAILIPRGRQERKGDRIGLKLSFVAYLLYFLSSSFPFAFGGVVALPGSVRLCVIYVSLIINIILYSIINTESSYLYIYIIYIYNII